MSSTARKAAGAAVLAAMSWLAVALPASDVRAQPAADEAAELYRQAREAFTAGELERTVELLEQAIRKDHRAVYIYNLARTLEGLGRYAEAHGQYLRAQAAEDVTEELRALSQAAVEKLAPMRSKGVVELAALEPGSVAQIDARVIVELDEEILVEPGRHQLCLTGPNADRTRCWSREVREGRRTSWPPETTPATRGEIGLPAEGVTAVSLGGHPLVLDLATVRVLEVDMGNHLVGLTPTAGEPAEQTVSVLSGRTVSLAAPKAAPEPAPALPPEAEDTGGAGPWPWITMGAGVVAVGAGVAMVVVSGQDRVAETEDYVGGKELTFDRLDEHRTAWNASRELESAGFALTALGAAAAVGGLVWALIGSGGGEDDEAAIWVAPTREGGVAMGGRF